MAELDRRRFLQLAGAAATAAAASTLSESIARAAALPAQNAAGSISDVEHVVILMQENRSFDHYFGSLAGVRGFGDPRPMLLGNGKSVWNQSSASGTSTLPFHPTATNLGLQFLSDLAHDWNSTHQAWNQGKWDQWIPAKGTSSMAYLNRKDIPFHYALADAFTICDAYHCSMMSATDPNRYYLFSGYVGNDGKGGGPIIDNSEAGYGWTTFPEVLQSAGVSWKVYQDVGLGLNSANSWGDTSNPYIGNYGDNSLLYFTQYQNAQPGSALYNGARTGTNVNAGGGYFDQLISDVKNNTLPQVSWIAAPEAYSEHPNWPANYGAWYVSQVLNALTANPAVWSKTALLITYDENDGFFDHLASPYPPASAAQGLSTVDVSTEQYTAGGSYTSGPYGLGPRVPMLVVSPWSRGGWVCSQTFDHTSIIQFLERRFNVASPNISPWRRAVCGDLTSAFNFVSPNAGVVSLPSTGGYVPPDKNRHASYTPTPPTAGKLPVQESGTRNARALPYSLAVDSAVVSGRLQLQFHNLGAVGAAYRVDSSTRNDGPWPYTVGAGKNLADTWYVPSGGTYQFSVLGPNGFLFQLADTLTKVGPEVTARQNAATGHLDLTFFNGTTTSTTFVGVDAYDPTHSWSYPVGPGASLSVPNWGVTSAAGWYDVSVTVSSNPAFLRRFAGHVETGNPSSTDPAILTA